VFNKLNLTETFNGNVTAGRHTWQ